MAAGLDDVLPDLRGTRVVLAVLDVHDVVRDALLPALPRAGAEVVLLPSDATPAGVVHAAVAEDADVVVLGTYNGAALAVGRELAAAVAATGYDGAVIIGGKLNQDTGGESRSTWSPTCAPWACSRPPRWPTPPGCWGIRLRTFT